MLTASVKLLLQKSPHLCLLSSPILCIYNLYSTNTTCMALRKGSHLDPNTTLYMSLYTPRVACNGKLKILPIRCPSSSKLAFFFLPQDPDWLNVWGNTKVQCLSKEGLNLKSGSSCTIRNMIYSARLSISRRVSSAVFFAKGNILEKGSLWTFTFSTWIMLLCLFIII